MMRIRERVNREFIGEEEVERVAMKGVVPVIMLKEMEMEV